MIKFDGDLENLTLPYYGFRAVTSLKPDEKIMSYSNGMFCVDCETREITFETSWLACNDYPNIEIKDLLVLTKMPIIKK